MKIKDPNLLNLQMTQGKHITLLGVDWIDAAQKGLSLDAYHKEHKQRVYKDAIAEVLAKNVADVDHADLVRVYRANLPFVRETVNGDSILSFKKEALKNPYAFLCYHASMRYSANISESLYNHTEYTDYFEIISGPMLRATNDVAVYISVGVPVAMQQGVADKAPYAYNKDAASGNYVNTPLEDIQKSIYSIAYGREEGYVVADNTFKLGHIPKKGQKASLKYDLNYEQWVALYDTTPAAPIDGQGLLVCDDYNATSKNIRVVDSVEYFKEPFPSLRFKIIQKQGVL